MKFARAAGALACLFFAWMPAAGAFDLNGAWSTDLDACAKLFVKKGHNVVFQRNSGVHGGGFVIAGDRIRGRSATCKLTKQREKGGLIQLLAWCETGIMLSSVQFTLRPMEDNKVARIFPDMEEMEVPYYRCPPL